MNQLTKNLSLFILIFLVSGCSDFDGGEAATNAPAGLSPLHAESDPVSGGREGAVCPK